MSKQYHNPPTNQKPMNFVFWVKFSRTSVVKGGGFIFESTLDLGTNNPDFCVKNMSKIQNFICAGIT